MEYVPGRGMDGLAGGPDRLPAGLAAGYMAQGAGPGARATGAGSCTATSSRRTSCWPATGGSWCWTSAWGRWLSRERTPPACSRRPTGSGSGPSISCRRSRRRGGRPTRGATSSRLGCTLYHLLTGELPFPGDSDVERLAARIKGLAVPMERHRPGLPEGLLEVAARMMSTRPEDRYPDAALAADALQEMADRGRVAEPIGIGCAAGSPRPDPEAATETIGGPASSGGDSASSSASQAGGLSRWIRLATLLAGYPAWWTLAALGSRAGGGLRRRGVLGPALLPE